MHEDRRLITFVCFAVIRDTFVVRYEIAISSREKLKNEIFLSSKIFEWMNIFEQWKHREEQRISWSIGLMK